MMDVLWHAGAALVALGGVYILWRKGTWPETWPVDGEPIILGLLGFVIYAIFVASTSAAVVRIQDSPVTLNWVVGGIRLACVAIAFCILKTLIHRADPMHVLKPKSRQEVVQAIAPYLLVLPLMYLVTTNVDQQAATDLMSFESFSGRASIFFGVVIVAPLFEELVFRGYLQGAMRRGYPAGVSVPVVAILFALVHEEGVRLPVFCLGLLLGVVYEKTRGFWAPWLIHTLHNLITYIFIVSGAANA